MLKRIAVRLFLLVTCCLLFVTPGFAEGEFAISYDVTYDVGLDGITTVTEKIALRNLTQQYYASQFKLTIGATDIFDIKAEDPGGALEVKSEKQDSLTIITVTFNQQVAGLDKELPWTLSFKSKDFAQNLGKIWEVRTPKISSIPNLENYNFTLSVPSVFGEPALISPKPKSQTNKLGKILFTFDKSQLERSGVSASFGNHQLFNFDLTYHLENDNLVSVLTNIALPPDTAYQDVFFQRINPSPLNVTLDEDGNYLAWYKVGRAEKLDINVTGSAKLYISSKAKEPSLTDELRKKYTEGAKYWETNNPIVAAALEKIMGDQMPADPDKKIELIYKYVVNSLKYNQERLKGEDIERLGAVTALSNPNEAVCMEFTDLFITLLRTAGIPARELNGYAYTANPSLRPLSLSKDILHAWPEYWDEKIGWVMVDPTWENTTGGVDYFNRLDLNHFVFVTKGISSQGPAPAGSYKYKGDNSQDVKVSLSDTDFLGKSQIDVEVESPKPILAGFRTKIRIKISNLGNSVFPSTNFSVNSGKIEILDAESKILGPIPAFGNASFELSARTRTLFDKFTDQIVITLGNQKFTRDLKVEPFFLFQEVPLILGVIVLTMLLLYGTILGVFFYRKRFLKMQ